MWKRFLYSETSGCESDWHDELLATSTLSRDDRHISARERVIRGRTTTVSEARQQQVRQLLPLAQEGFPIHEVVYPLRVDGKGCVEVGNQDRGFGSRGCAKRASTGEQNLPDKRMSVERWRHPDGYRKFAEFLPSSSQR